MAEKPKPKPNKEEPEQIFKVIFPDGSGEQPKIFKRMAEVNDLYPNINFEIAGMFPPIATSENVMETVIQLKWKLHKLVLISHGQPTGQVKELPRNVTLVFYCDTGETWRATMHNLPSYVSAVCAGSKRRSGVVNAGQNYEDLRLTYEFTLQDFNTVKPCDPVWTPIEFGNGSLLSELIANLNSGFLWELHVTACRSGMASKKTTSTFTTVSYDSRGRPILESKRVDEPKMHGGCQAVTHKGYPCKRHGDPYCYQHRV